MLKSKIIAGIILLFGILILSACENLDLGKLSEEDINKFLDKDINIVNVRTWSINKDNERGSS